MLTWYPPLVRYLAGGVESGFRKVERDRYEPRLLQVKGRRNIRVQQVGMHSQCSVLMCCFVFCSVLLCCFVLCSVLLCCFVLCCVLFCSIVLCCVVLCCAVLCCAMCCVVMSVLYDPSCRSSCPGAP